MSREPFLPWGANVETPSPSHRPAVTADKNCKIVRQLRRCSGLALVGGCPPPLALAPSLSEEGCRLDNLSFGREDEKHGEKRFVPETASSQLVRPPRARLAETDRWGGANGCCVHSRERQGGGRGIHWSFERAHHHFLPPSASLCFPPPFAIVLDGGRHDSARTASTRVGGVHGSLQRVGALTAVIFR